MSAGAEGAAAPRRDDMWRGEQDAAAARAGADTYLLETIVEEQPEAAPRGRPVLAGALLLLAAGWLGACAYSAYLDAAPLGLAAILGRIATASVPLALLALAWLLWGRTGRRESARFTEALAAMRGEAQSLDIVLGLVAEKLAGNRVQLSHEAERLMTLGEEASDRLGRVTHYLARESEGLDTRAQGIEAAAAAARVDIGVLLADLPQAEQAARSFSETVREAGIAAHERAHALEAQLSAIAARAQDADTATGGAAERLGAHISRIESSAGVAAQQLEGAAARLDALVDAALGRTSDAVEATRAALASQSDAMFASIEEGRARFIEAGAEAGGQVAGRLDEAQRLVAAIAAGLAAQERESEALVGALAARVAALDEQFAALGSRAEGQSTQLASALAGLRDATATLRAEVDASTQEAVALVARTGEMAGALDAVGERLRSELPPALSEVEARAAAMRAAAEAAVEPVRAVQAAATDGAAKLAEAEASVARQQAELANLSTGLDRGLATVGQRLGELAALAIETDHAIGVVIRDAGPELVETLVRVRETARAAAGHAREAIGAVIPESAQALSDAAGAALGDSITASVRQQMSELEAGAQRAASAARAASERLTRQLLNLGQNAAALEDRIIEERAARDEQAREAMPRRVALLIESLNSTAIDVTKILSNDVTDTAWQAYLKGDRGVFTRRAVRLLDSGEAREIERHYDQEIEFREQVNRYIADFEAMLRRILADGDGHPLAVTLLSSDMGKLYVALAQAIHHLKV